MRQKSSPKLMLLMTLPVVALLVVGWFLRDKRGTFTPPLPQTGPLQMVVTDVKFEELKPREVAEGFDTKVTLTLDLAGQLPARKNATLFFVPQVGKVDIKGLPRNPGNWKLRNGETVALEVNEQRRDLNATMTQTNNGEREQPQVSFLFKLSSLPASSTRTVVNCRLHGVLMWRTMQKVGTASYPSWRPGGVMPWFPFEVVLRKPNQKILTPQVSRAQNIDIQKVTTRYESTQSMATEGVMRIDIEFRYEIEPSKSDKEESSFNFGQPYIEDARGRRYTRYNYGSRNRLSSSGHGLNEEEATGKALFEVPYEQIPPSVGQLTFKAQLSVNDSWPTPFSVVIRTQAESDPPKPSPFRLVGTSKSQEQDMATKRMNTWLAMQLRYNGTENLHSNEESRIIVAAERVVDSLGREQDVFRGHSLPGGDNKTKLYGVSYALDLSKIPPSAGRLTFKSEIGMKGYKFLPVSVVVRK